MKKPVILVLFLTAASISLLAQKFSIKRVELAGNDINIYYDLIDSVAHREYTVNVFSSKDNYISQLTKLSGDIGLEVRPGQNKKITWNAKEELGTEFIGKIALEIRGRIYIPFVRLDGLYKKMKRTKDYEITWTGGTQQNILNFDLYRKGEKVTSFPNIANVGHFTLNLPSGTKPGGGYNFKISDTKNRDQIVNTAPFRVKRKVPLLLKTVLVIGVAVGISQVLPKPSTASHIDDAPLPPSQ